MKINTVAAILLSTIFVVVVFAFFFTDKPATERWALVISSDLSATDASGKEIDTSRIEVGTRIKVRSTEDGRFTFPSDEKVAFTDGAQLAFELTDNDCFAISLEKALESPLFDKTVRGRGKWYGPALELILNVSATLGAKIEICLTIDQPVVLRPKKPGFPGPQKMAAISIDYVTVDSLPPPPPPPDGNNRLTRFGAEAEVKVILEAYCLDSERDIPTRDDLFELDSVVVDEQLVQVLSNPDGLSNKKLVHCVWAARSFSVDFARDLVEKKIRRMIKNGSSRSQIMDSLSQVESLLLRSHRGYLSRCPTFSEMCTDNCTAQSLKSSTPWTTDEIKQIIIDVLSRVEK